MRYQSHLLQLNVSNERRCHHPQGVLDARLSDHTRGRNALTMQVTQSVDTVSPRLSCCLVLLLACWCVPYIFLHVDVLAILLRGLTAS